MELKEIYQKDLCVGSGLSYPRFSFEVFPPKDGDSSKLFEELRVLKKYNPALVSLTYGANGGNRQFSYELLQMILDLELNVMPHFTCVGATKEIIELYIMQIENLGIENILALRGDLSEDISINDFKYASDLVDFIHQKSTLSIGVAGYPECHIECENLDKDIDNLKRKIDLGASAIFTQLFFDNDKFYSYCEKVCKAGIEVPIIPGIMPIRSLKQIEKMISMTHVEIPKTLRERLEKYPNDVKKVGVDFAIDQCQQLIDSEVCGLHFFTLNHSDQVSEILDGLSTLNRPSRHSVLDTESINAYSCYKQSKLIDSESSSE